MDILFTSGSRQHTKPVWGRQTYIENSQNLTSLVLLYLQQRLIS